MHIEFLHGQHFPNCQIHINTVFDNYYAIQLMTAGSMYFQRGSGNAVEISKPTFFWTDRKSHYKYGPGATGSWDHNWISFTGDTANLYYLELLESLAPQGYIPVSNADHLLRAFHDLLQAIHVRSSDHFTQIHKLNRVLVRVDEGKPSNIQYDAKIKAVIDAIDAKPEANYDFHRLAHENGYSYSNFRRLFNEIADTPPQRYLLARRMQKAAEHLLQTTESVQAVGFHYGYDDPARFTKAFKKHHGLAPRDYRQRILR
jgi:AraC-like DNA-binding protein